VEKIISAQNTLIKETKKLQQKKYRDLTKKYLVEGIRMVEEGLQYDILESFFYDETIYKTERGSKLVHKIEDYVKTQNRLTETETPQGIVAVARQKITELFSLTQDKEAGLILIIDGIQDPGNLGTLLRTAWACGTQAVICLPGTVEPFNNKAVRATMGSIFQVPLIINESWTNIYNWCNKHEYKLVAGDINGETDYSQVLYPPKVALIIGNEGQGLLSVSSDQVDYKVKIPLLNGVESLNASVAGGILLYEIIKRKVPKSCHYG
jgi:TrmH family RNA methyltransferase